jgi:O-antigen/teichoic acid export membrane protein
VVAGSLVYAALTVLRAALGMAIAVVVARTLGQQTFGRWTLLTTWAALLTMGSDLGTSLWLTRAMARDPAQGPALAATAAGARLAVLLTIGLPATALASRVQGADAATALGAAWVLAVAGALQGSVAAIFRGAEWLRALLTVELLGVGLQATGTWVVLSGPQPRVEPLLWTAALAQCGQLAAALLWWRPSLTRVPSSPVSLWVQTRRLVTDAWPLAGLGFLAQLQARWTPLVLGAIGGEAAVGLFGAAARITEAVKLLPQAALGALFPVWSAAYDPARAPDVSGPVSEGWRRSLPRVTAAGAAVVALMLWWVGPSLVARLFGPGFESAATPLLWLGVALVPTLVNGITRVELLAAEREPEVVRATIVSLALQVACSVPLMAAWGAGGAAVSVLLGESLLWLRLRRHATAQGIRAGCTGSTR